MSQFFAIHPQNPQQRLIAQAAAIVRNGGIIAYPTDAAYALGCHLGNRDGVERIRRLRGLSPAHYFTLICRDLSELSLYAKVDNTAFKMIKSLTPGPFTFILPATSEVPRRFLNPKRRTIGLRVPDSPIVSQLLDTLGEPMMSTSCQLPGEELPLSDAEDISDRLGKQLDLVIDGGPGGIETTTLVDLTGESPELLRQGKGLMEGVF